jgi:hypothetical protein
MEKLKSLSEVLQADPRNSFFVRRDTLEPLDIEGHHTEVAAIALDPKVPEDVQGYFATIQNVYLYAWFSYDLYAVVHFLCVTATEMALRKRLPYAGSGKDKRGLQNLMDEAVTRNLIREKAFSNVREMRKNLADEIRVRRSMGKFPKSTLLRSNYAAVLRGCLPWLRNSFAHPKMHAVLGPGEALFQIRFTSEFINQLFG